MAIDKRKQQLNVMSVDCKQFKNAINNNDQEVVGSNLYGVNCL